MTKKEYVQTRFGLEKLFGDLPADHADLAALLWKQGYSEREIKSFVRHTVRDNVPAQGRSE